MRLSSLAACAAALLAAGCSSEPEYVWGTAAVDVTGGMWGYESRAKTSRATLEAAETTALHQPVTWEAGDTRGAVVPMSEHYQDIGGRKCRTLRQEATRDGTTRARNVTACRQVDGTWIVSDFHPPENAKPE
jgi:surface antigen